MGDLWPRPPRRRAPECLRGQRAPADPQTRRVKAPRVSALVGVQVLFVLFGMLIAAFFPFFAPFLRSRDLRPEQIGTVFSLMALARIAMNPWWGHLADTRLERRRDRAGAVGRGAHPPLRLHPCLGEPELRAHDAAARSVALERGR